MPPITFTHREKLLLRWLIHTGQIEEQDKSVMLWKVGQMLKEDGEKMVLTLMPGFRN